MIWATIGGVTAGLAFLSTYLIKSAPTLKAAQKDPFGTAVTFLPFFYGVAYGTLGVLSVAGILAWAFDLGLWALNWAGDLILFLGVGVEVGVQSRGRTLPLTDYGSSVVLLLTVITFLLIKYRKCGWAVKMGTLTGLALGTTAGVAGHVAVPLANGANWLGNVVYDMGAQL